MDKDEILTLDLFVTLRKKLKREFLNACDTEAKFDGPAVFRSSWCFFILYFVFFYYVTFISFSILGPLLSN